MVSPGEEGLVSEQYTIGIDFGTEGCRVGLFDLQGRQIGVAAESYPTSYPHPGWAEQDPRDWWLALGKAARTVLAQTHVRAQDVFGVSADATTMTVVASDGQGVPLRPAIMWMDVRASTQAERALSTDSQARLYNAGGTGPASAEWYPFKVAWMKEHEPDIYATASRIVDATDWVTYMLTGDWAVNTNSAALRMYHNADRGGWPRDFYEHVGIGDVFSKLPERLVYPGEAVGVLSGAAATHLGLKAGIPVGQGATDASAGVIGLGVVRPGKAVLITGSSHALFGQAATAVHGNGFWGSYTNAIIRGQYTVEAGQASSGSVMKWFRDQLARDVVAQAERENVSAYDLLNVEAADIPIGSDGLIVNEYFQGNRTPYTDAKARGLFWGLSLAHTRAHLYHAIQEGICYGTAHNLRVMAASGFDVTEIVVSGGMTKSRALLQLHADITGVSMKLTEVSDAPVLGSAMCAAVGAGAYSDLPTAASAMVHEIVRIEPDPARHDEYSFYVDAYCAGYPAIRDQTHRLVDHETAKHRNDAVQP
jgi:ribulokinase